MKTKQLARLIVCALFATWMTGASPTAWASEKHELTWGICGHPSNNQPLWSDQAAQFATLELRGFKTYRFDIPLTSHTPEAITMLQKMVDLAKEHHVTLHPILYVPFTWSDPTDGGKYPETDAGLEAQGYDRVYPVALQFAGSIHDWELQNELTLRKSFKSGAGLSKDDYATPVAKQWAAVLRGMSRAIHDAGAKTGEPLRTVVNTVYADFGFVPFLESQGVKVDKLAYHYYYGADTDPYKVSVSSGTVDLFAELKKIGKPIIVNEFNAGEIYSPTRSMPYDDAKALVGLKRHIDYLREQTEANIEGVEFYELYDEPSKRGVESNFGLMKDPGHPKTQMLLAAAYTCGELGKDERAKLVASGLFTEKSLATRLATCHAGNP
ncbi:hypothetical protein [Dyella subtropica]|uniref:hypothetical protein n=1 Tax=Dyella subtropica TaxID=2992127 RepID=UPI0022575364|nr:hypothetical protein [Dyella subtropica]